MATDSYWQLEREYFTIAKDHDLIVRVIEHKEVIRTKGGGDDQQIDTERVANKVYEYKVNREVLRASGHYFESLLSDNALTRLDLHEDNAAVMTLWLKLVHDKGEDASMYEVTLDEVWHFIATAYKYDFDTSTNKAKAWFDRWYNLRLQSRHFDYKEHQSLLLPTYTFDHAEGFKSATKYLVYRATSNVNERRPQALLHNEDLALDQNIINQLNAAKGRLRTMLHRTLYSPIDDLIKRAQCRCKAHVLYAYEQALSATGGWPLHTAFLNNSVEFILRKLEHNFPAQSYHPQTCGSQLCTFDFSAVISAACTEVRRYFDGLCLDCMTNSAENEGVGGEYWRQSNPGMHWDHGCRVRHSQSSWYFSFQGPRYKMVEWIESKRHQHGRGRGMNGHAGRTHPASAEAMIEGVAGMSV